MTHLKCTCLTFTDIRFYSRTLKDHLKDDRYQYLFLRRIVFNFTHESQSTVLYNKVGYTIAKKYNTNSSWFSTPIHSNHPPPSIPYFLLSAVPPFSYFCTPPSPPPPTPLLAQQRLRVAATASREERRCIASGPRSRSQRDAAVDG